MQKCARSKLVTCDEILKAYLVNEVEPTYKFLPRTFRSLLESAHLKFKAVRHPPCETTKPKACI